MTAPVTAWQQAVNSAWDALQAAAPAPPGDRDRRVQQAINRARSQLGVAYSWGGGNQNGPTFGVRDGGVADSYGDYLHKGFDCSGLMEYAFAGSGANVVRPAAAESRDGQQVPWAQREPGDLLFYANKTDGIHHVALYTGKNAQGQDMMVEAEQSGTRVHEVPVRVNGELMKNVTRPIR